MNSVALVTGGAMGIGRAICDLLLQQGCKVAIVDVNKTVGQTAAAELEQSYGSGRVRFLECDVASSEMLKGVFDDVMKDWGHIDILCNNAGGGFLKSWQFGLTATLNSVIESTSLYLKTMKEGVVINVASTWGLGASGYAPVYSAAKAGVIVYTRALAKERRSLSPGIRLGCVCPGATATRMFRELQNRVTSPDSQYNDEKKVYIKELNMQPPEVVAKAVLKLIIDDSKTGQVLKVDNSKMEYIHFEHDEPY